MDAALDGIAVETLFAFACVGLFMAMKLQVVQKGSIEKTAVGVGILAMVGAVFSGSDQRREMLLLAVAVLSIWTSVAAAKKLLASRPRDVKFFEKNMFKKKNDKV